MRTAPILIPALLLAGCYHPYVRVAERDRDTLDALNESPVFVELPPDAPAPELHTEVDSLTIADATTFDMNFRGTDLQVALAEIAARAEIMMIPDEDITGAVDLSFNDITLDDALNTLLKQHDLVLLPGPGDVFFVERSDDPKQVTEFIQLVNVRAADVEKNLANLVGEGARVITDNDRNLICLIGRQSDVSAVRRYLHHVDKLKDQVLLEVHIFEVAYEDGFNLGAIADASGTVNGNAWNILSAFGQGSSFTGTLVDNDGDFNLTLDAIRTHVGLELVSSPRVLAVTNTQALVDVVREIPYVQVTATTTGTTGGAGSVVQEEVQFKEAGIQMQITPSIQEAGFLQIDIVQSISEEVDRFNDIPVVDKRSLTTQFLVKDRQTIVLGGLIQNRHAESRSGVPILMNVPLVGQLFRGDADRRKKQEILIFVTPRVVSPNQAAFLADHYQDTYRESRQDLFFPINGMSSPMDGPQGVPSATPRDEEVPDEEASAEQVSDGQAPGAASSTSAQPEDGVAPE